MHPNSTIHVPSPQYPTRRRRTVCRQLLTLLAGSSLALAMQTPVLAQVATNMVNFYVDGGQPAMAGPAVVGSSGDIWNAVNGGGGLSGACQDVLGNPVNDNISISWCGGLFGGDATGPATANLFYACLLDYCGTAINVSVTGLAANTDYIMYNYTIGGGGNTGGTLTWTDGTGATLTATADNTSYTPTSFVPNQNYTVLTGQSDANGAINFTLSNVGYPCWNGMQLVPVPRFQSYLFNRGPRRTALAARLSSALAP